jgi:hypothetical protein
MAEVEAVPGLLIIPLVFPPEDTTAVIVKLRHLDQPQELGN